MHISINNEKFGKDIFLAITEGVSMDKDTENQLKAFITIESMVKSLKEKIINRDRFFITHELLDLIKKHSDRNTITIEKNGILFRARICDNSFIKSNFSVFNYKNYTFDYSQPMALYDSFSGKQIATFNDIAEIKKPVSDIKENRIFYGYGKDESFVPPNNDIVGNGRANPQYIKYLYVALDPYTAMIEVRPILESYVSIAQIEVLEDLKIMDLSLTFSANKNIEQENRILRSLLSYEFSRPSSGELKEYLLTQCISEYIKSQGFDGVMFSSSLNKNGLNITIFNYNKCQPVGSVVFQVNAINYSAYCIKSDKYASLNETK